MSEQVKTELREAYDEIAQLEWKLSKAKREREDIETSITAAKKALAAAVPDATMLANKAEGMDWGEVSDRGCDVLYFIEQALRALAAAERVERNP